jgi:hypothetical protein
MRVDFKNKGFFAILLTMTLMVCSCSPAAATQAASALPPTSAPTAVPALTVDELKNMTYTSAGLLDLIPKDNPIKTIKLVNGQFHLKIDPNSASETVVSYVQSAFGDLNRDGLDDAAVILASNGGGSGTFIFLVGVINHNGKGQDMAAVQLGDRIKIDGLMIKDGKIQVNYLKQGPNDPMCCPSQKTTSFYALNGNRLGPPYQY